MRKSASSTPGIVPNLSYVSYQIAREKCNAMHGPAVGNLTCADHTRERGAVQRFIVVPEYREREERAVRYDEMRSVNGTLLTNKLLLQ